ncbi:MAG: hypothetical protein IJW72_04315, partial [Alphaproteobacteria bacterium]|nr:hypothetical protein [Alphaproteobacteria bacterium]
VVAITKLLKNITYVLEATSKTQAFGYFCETFECLFSISYRYNHLQTHSPACRTPAVRYTLAPFFVTLGRERQRTLT